MGKKIIILDDEPKVATILTTRFLDFTTLHANTVNEAKAYIKETEIDYLIVDLCLDQKNPKRLEGLDFIEYLSQQGSSSCIIAITRLTNQKMELRKLALDKGATHFILKTPVKNFFDEIKTIIG